MPELPEVEVTRRRLAPLLVGRRIRRVIVGPPSYFFVTAPDVLARALTGETPTALERHGKYLLLHLDGDGAGRRVLLHLGMTGQLFAETAASPRLLASTSRSALAPEAQRPDVFTPDQHTHLSLEYDAGPCVHFRDVRKFGKVAVLGPRQSDPRLDKLGVDALVATGDELWAAARKRSTPIKALLLDQAVIAGIGNIYADEALFLAGVKPTRAARRVARATCHRLVEAARVVMLRSIETGGSSISDYVQPDGADGGYQDERRVYGLTGEPCRACATAIRRVVIQQRSTHFCPKCQPR